MAESQSFFMECFKETQYHFPGSNPHTLGQLAARLHKSLTPGPSTIMTRAEAFRRCEELSTALESMSQWRGWRPGDGRFANAKDED